MCVKLSLQEFDDGLNVVDILDQFLNTSSLDAEIDDVSCAGSEAFFCAVAQALSVFKCVYRLHVSY